MLTAFFTDKEVVDFETAKSSDVEKFGKFFRLMLERGVYLAPSQFEAAFLSTSHSDDDIAETLNKAEDSFKLLK
jgi:glutamate-1-semialdehyde 2,1-aminomutase